MNNAIERLLSLRVRDIMNSNVVHVNEDATMGKAAVILEQNDITGAPVVDATGRCVGVLSTSDFVYRETQLTRGTEQFELGIDRLATAVKESTSMTDQLVQGNHENQVSQFMSPVVQTISPEATIMNAARLICGEHIHRLVIVDEEERPIGIVSSLDLVDAMVAAVEE